MLKIFYGEERAQAQVAIDRLLGDDYEVIAADELTPNNLPTTFLGVTLFSEERKILIKDLDLNKECWEQLPKYLDTPHKVIIWNLRAPDKRGEPGKSLANDKRVEIKGFERVVTKEEKFASFNIYEEAARGRADKALKILAESKVDPYQTLGAFVSKAMAALEQGNRKAPAILKVLAAVDYDMKTTGIDATTLLKKAILQIANTK